MLFRTYKQTLCYLGFSLFAFYYIFYYIISLFSFSLVLWQASEELYDMLQSMLIRIR